MTIPFEEVRLYLRMQVLKIMSKGINTGILNQMKTVYILQHSYDLEDCEEAKFIGVYSSEQEAKNAILRLENQPGFKENPNDFYIEKYEVDKDHWTEGFITIF